MDAYISGYLDLVKVCEQAFPTTASKRVIEFVSRYSTTTPQGKKDIELSISDGFQKFVEKYAVEIASGDASRLGELYFWSDKSSFTKKIKKMDSFVVKIGNVASHAPAVGPKLIEFLRKFRAQHQILYPTKAAEGLQQDVQSVVDVFKKESQKSGGDLMKTARGVLESSELSEQLGSSDKILGLLDSVADMVETAGVKFEEMYKRGEISFQDIFSKMAGIIRDLKDTARGHLSPEDISKFKELLKSQLPEDGTEGGGILGSILSTVSEIGNAVKRQA